MTNPIIIGAGIAGLVAALELENAGYSPTVLEATDRAGGRVKTDTIDGNKLDHGFQVLLTAYPEAKRYLDYDKLELVYFSPGSVIYKDAKPLRIGDPQRNLSFLWSTITAGIGSLRDKMLILKLANLVKKKSVHEIFSSVEKTTFKYLQDFGFSSSMIENFFQPFFTGIFLEEKLTTSSRMFEFVYKMFSEGHAAVPKNGIQAISDQLVSRLSKTTLRFNTAVRKIENKNIDLENGESIQANQIIIATDPNPFFTSDESQQTDWKSCYNIYLRTEGSTLNETIIGLLPNSELLVNNFHFLEDTFGKKNDSVISVTLVKDHNLDEKDLVDRVKDELQHHCGIRAAELLKTYYIKKALPDITDLQLIPSSNQTTIRKGIYVCGDHLTYGSLNAAMANGRQAAEALIKDLV